MEVIEIYVDSYDNIRLDAYLSQKLNQMSRTRIKNLINNKNILVNKEHKKPRYPVKKGDYIEIRIPEPKKIEIIPENIPIDIIYEDDDIVIVNKPQDMIVHPAPGQYTKTLVNALLYHIENLPSINEIIRPGIVHRLDKNTSGLLVVAKNDYAHKFLSVNFKKRKIKRQYIALVKGVVSKDKGIINAPIGRNTRDRRQMAVTSKNSKEAITRYKVLRRFDNYTLLQLRLETGRTHQIRVHLSYINHPILGDPVYFKEGNIFGLDAQLLHGIKLGFTHPRSNEYVEFETEIPDRFMKIIEKIE